MRRRTLPTSVSGSVSRNSMSFGTRYPVRPIAGSLHHALISSRVHHPNVALLERSVADRERRLFGPVPVPDHGLRPADAELAALAGLDLAVGVLEIHDLAVGVGHRHTDRSRPPPPLPRGRVGGGRGLRGAAA